MSLPFQATECYLAHVQPVDGTSYWSADACEFFGKLVSNKVHFSVPRVNQRLRDFPKIVMLQVVSATVIGYTVEEHVPVVEIELDDENGKVRRITVAAVIIHTFCSAFASIAYCSSSATPRLPTRPRYVSPSRVR